jgi:type II secretion system (T2SS) protein E
MTNDTVEVASETRRTALGTLLIERGQLDEARLEEALEIGEAGGERLGEVLVRMGWVSEEELAKTLADQWHLRYTERSAISFDREALRRMSREDAAKLEALPIQVGEDGVLSVALAEPTESRLMALRTLLGDHIDFVVVAKGAIEAGLHSDLLARSGSVLADPVDEIEPVNETVPVSETVPANEAASPFGEQETYQAPSEPTVVASDSGQPSKYDEVAGSLTESLGTHLGSIRAMVAELEAQRQQDRREIERLESELSGRDVQLAERGEAIKSAEQMLRDLADTLTQSQTK